eukprot:m.64325 g.64325  ORF g.64325 m.64325 type:complete len:406 (-) comp12006_c0_seq1:617-1834(-)
MASPPQHLLDTPSQSTGEIEPASPGATLSTVKDVKHLVLAKAQYGPDALKDVDHVKDRGSNLGYSYSTISKLPKSLRQDWDRHERRKSGRAQRTESLPFHLADMTSLDAPDDYRLARLFGKPVDEFPENPSTSTILKCSIDSVVQDVEKEHARRLERLKLELDTQKRALQKQLNEEREKALMSNDSEAATNFLLSLRQQGYQVPVLAIDYTTPYAQIAIEVARTAISTGIEEVREQAIAEQSKRMVKPIGDGTNMFQMDEDLDTSRVMPHRFNVISDTSQLQFDPSVLGDEFRETYDRMRNMSARDAAEAEARSIKLLEERNAAASVNDATPRSFKDSSASSARVRPSSFSRTLTVKRTPAGSGAGGRVTTAVPTRRARAKTFNTLSQGELARRAQMAAQRLAPS